MSEHRCGTCRHWTRYLQSYGGTCGVLVAIGSSIHINEDLTGCPAWNPHPPADERIPNNLWCVFDTRGHLVGAYLSPEDAGRASGWGASIVGYAHDMDQRAYARGWRDAIAAAKAKLVEQSNLHWRAATENNSTDHLRASNALAIAADDIAALQPPG